MTNYWRHGRHGLMVFVAVLAVITMTAMLSVQTVQAASLHAATQIIGVDHNATPDLITEAIQRNDPATITFDISQVDQTQWHQTTQLGAVIMANSAGGGDQSLDRENYGWQSITAQNVSVADYVTLIAEQRPAEWSTTWHNAMPVIITRQVEQSELSSTEVLDRQLRAPSRSDIGRQADTMRRVDTIAITSGRFDLLE